MALQWVSLFSKTTIKTKKDINFKLANCDKFIVFEQPKSLEFQNRHLTKKQKWLITKTKKRLKHALLVLPYATIVHLLAFKKPTQK
jgi:hypothetical protein